MLEWFTTDYTGAPFEMFGTTHLITLVLALCAPLLVVLFRKQFTPRGRVIFRWTLAIIIIANEILVHVWKAYYGLWDIKIMLPLWVCSVLIWCTPLVLIWKNYRVYEFTYFMGAVGALMAMGTPDLTRFGFPHLMYWQFFIGHTGLWVTIAYMTAVEGMRPTWKSLFRVWIGMNLYWGFTAIVNVFLGSNYLYTAGKLETASALDVLGPYPQYLVIMELIATAYLPLWYLPWAVRDWLVSRRRALPA